jgi:mannose-6-phosphate isomerase-like protein (cupin superfamily)
MNPETKEYGLQWSWADTENYVGKLHWINPGKIMGMRFNKENERSFYIICGHVRVWYSGRSGDFKDYNPSETFHIKPKQIYRIGTTDESEQVAFIIEVGTNILDDEVTLEKYSS